MNPKSTRVYAPVLRGPLLFHQNTALTVPSYYTTRPASTSSATSLYTHPSPYTHQAQYSIQAPMPLQPQFQTQSFPYSSALSRPTFPSTAGVSYSYPTVTYVPTVAPNGLSLILIATLILVALDLVIVRPQKLRSEK